MLYNTNPSFPLTPFHQILQSGQHYLFYFSVRFPGVQKPLDQYGDSQSGTVPVKTSGDDDEDDDFELFGDDDEVSNI